MSSLYSKVTWVSLYIFYISFSIIGNYCELFYLINYDLWLQSFLTLSHNLGPDPGLLGPKALIPGTDPGVRGLKTLIWFRIRVCRERRNFNPGL